ncbi:hypothetical protein GC173_16010, partial [bacterium]|nr:hypothetical protein [bacterium]
MSADAVPHSPAAPNRAFLVVVYLVGLALWAVFFSFGNMPAGHNDWPKEIIYYNHLASGLRFFNPPWHLGFSVQGTNRLLANPEVCLGPAILSLFLVGPKLFLLLNHLLAYSAGFIGLVKLASRWSLDMPGILIAWALLNWNGHLLAHLAVGHSMWSGWLLLPWVILGVEMFRDPDRYVRRRGVAVTALGLGGLLLQGTLHVYIWMLGVVTVAALVGWRHWREALLLPIVCVAIGLFRFLPAAVAFRPTSEGLFAGYTGVGYLVRCIAWPLPYAPEPPAPGAPAGMLLGAWEYSQHIGVIGTALALLAVFAALTRRKGSPVWSTVWVTAAALLLFFSFGNNYRPLHATGLPLLGAERGPARFAGLAALLLAFAGLASWQRMRWALWARWAAACVLLAELTVTFLQWRPAGLIDANTPEP